MMKKQLSWLLAGILSFSILCPFPASAAGDTEYDSDTETFQVAGYTYDVYSCLYEGSGYRAGTWVIADRNVPDKYIGVSASLYTESGDLLVSKAMSYNYGSINFHYATTKAKNSSEAVYSQGDVQLYTGSGTRYVSFEAPATRCYGGSRRAALDTPAFSNAAISDYPVNTKGQTYGSGLNSKLLGEKPDLISAVSPEGLRGYVLAADLYPEIHTTAEIARYTSAVAENPFIPLYDVEGNVIGQFELSAEDEDVQELPLVQAKLAELRLAAAEMRTPQPAAASQQAVTDKLMSSLINGQYPTNSRGETYGPRHASRIVGCEPDWISAIGLSGKKGYVRREDLHPERDVKTLEDAANYMRTTPDSQAIPLCDCEGNMIDYFILG